DQFHPPVSSAPLGGVVVTYRAGIGITDCLKALSRYAVGLEIAHHTAGPCAGELPVGGIAHVTPYRDAVRVALHGDFVTDAGQHIHNSPQYGQAGTAQISLAAVEQYFAVHSEAD